ncbi:hypothetical protein XH93_18330 [Bradyrhizobium sp. CCBAU 51753]|nr:hypothetical protein XH93_18330 [Bradyrhizobium sp. CCBAU 51753]
MAWRWRDPKPEQRKPKQLWPDTEDDKVLRTASGPDRGEDIPPDATWLPMTGDEKDGWEGGYWEEPRSVAEAEFEKAKAARRGFCGLTIPPGHES